MSALRSLVSRSSSCARVSRTMNSTDAVPMCSTPPRGPAPLALLYAAEMAPVCGETSGGRPALPALSPRWSSSCTGAVTASAVTCTASCLRCVLTALGAAAPAAASASARTDGRLGTRWRSRPSSPPSTADSTSAGANSAPDVHSSSTVAWRGGAPLLSLSSARAEDKLFLLGLA
eukprot:1659004-Prymnesium_polylepis.1